MTIERDESNNSVLKNGITFIDTSSDGSLLAFVPLQDDDGTAGTTIKRQPNGFRISIWSNITRNLQSTLHYRGITTDETLQKLLFLNNHLIATVWDKTIIVWDITRGVIAYEIPADKNQNNDEIKSIIYDATASLSSSSIPLLHVLTTTTTSSRKSKKRDSTGSKNTDESSTTKESIEIQEYNATTGKLVRIVKAGKSKKQNNSMKLGVTESKLLVVSAFTGVRALNRTDGSKLWKIEEESLFDKVHDTNRVSSVSLTENYIALVVSTSDTESELLIMDLSDGKILKNAGNVKLGGNILSSIQFVDSMLVRLNRSEIYKIIIKDTAKSYELSKHTEFCNDEKSRIITVQIASDGKTAMILLQNPIGNQTQLQRIPLSSTPTTGMEFNKVTIEWNSKSSRKNEENKQDDDIVVVNKVVDGNNKKRKSNTVNELDDETNRRKRVLEPEDDDDDDDIDNDDMDDENDDYDDEEPTIGERLQILQEALDSMDEESDEDDDVPIVRKKTTDTLGNNKGHALTKNVTTESLTNLLVQALQSADDAMLEIALNVKDTLIVQKTLQELSSHNRTILIAQITNRIAYKPARFEHLLVWVQAILSLPPDIIYNHMNHLRPLQNLLMERVEVFQDLVQLESTLNLIL